MNVEGFIDLDYVRHTLMMPDTVTKYDEVISFVLEDQTIQVFNHLGIDETVFGNYNWPSPTFTEVQLDPTSLVKHVIAARIGCQIMKSDPSFGEKYNRWKVGNTEKGFQRRIKYDYEDWCEYSARVMGEAESMIQGHADSVVRRGLLDDFNSPPGWYGL
jgi:hypothetical protein